jgi:hypothetical protein
MIAEMASVQSQQPFVAGSPLAQIKAPTASLTSPTSSSTSMSMTKPSSSTPKTPVAPTTPSTQRASVLSELEDEIRSQVQSAGDAMREFFHLVCLINKSSFVVGFCFSTSIRVIDVIFVIGFVTARFPDCDFSQNVVAACQ